MAALLGLFASAFLAATILPFSSEAVLAALTVAGGADVALLWAVASAGNILGAVVNWLLGRFCLRFQDRRWFPVKPPDLERGATLVRPLRRLVAAVRLGADRRRPVDRRRRAVAGQA